VEKKDTLASHPELKRSADGLSKKSANRFSSRVCWDVDPDSKREPVEPKIWGDVFIRSRKFRRADSEAVTDR
jgi:hypothetical protein